MEVRGPSLVLVADGGRARLFEERRRGGALVEITARLGDLAVSRPLCGASAGRAHQRVGRASHDGEDQPFDAKREAAFLRRLAERVGLLAQGAGYEDLVVIAAPKALGRLRRHLHGRLGPTESRDCLAETAGDIRSRLLRIRAGA